MGLLTNIVSATVKTALTPVAILKDAADVISGEEAENTKDLLKSASGDLGRAVDTVFRENDDGLI
jgi:hypothetical protein